MEDKLWTVEETAKFLGCSPKTVYGWAQSGHMPAYKLKRLVRFDSAEVKAWVEKNRVNQAVPAEQVRRKGKPRRDLDIDLTIRRNIDSLKPSGYTPH